MLQNLAKPTMAQTENGYLIAVKSLRNGLSKIEFFVFFRAYLDPYRGSWREPIGVGISPRG
jgi:hypothetical protein